MSLASVAQDGSTIGVVADEMRKEHLLPIDANEFSKRYSKAFSIKWSMHTNSSGVIELSQASGAIWSISPGEGEVWLVASTNLESPDAVLLFKGVDFSKPLSTYYSKSLSPETVREIKRSSDVVWGAFSSRKK